MSHSEPTELSSFQEALKIASELVVNDDNVVNVITIVLTKDDQLHTITDITADTVTTFKMLEGAAEQIAKAKVEQHLAS